MGSIRLAWWNLQNLFDTDDDPISADLEFTVAKGWTSEVYAAKLANLATAIVELHDGQGPELLGVCEVEGDAVFQELLDAVGNPHLKIVRDPGGTSDLRGIDTSLAYDERKLRPAEQQSHVVHLRYATRDIFEVVFEIVETGERLVVIATHWPSRTKAGGARSPCGSRWPRTSPGSSAITSASTRSGTSSSRRRATWPPSRRAGRPRC
jgi:hypothetical protein